MADDSAPLDLSQFGLRAPAAAPTAPTVQDIGATIHGAGLVAPGTSSAALLERRLSGQSVKAAPAPWLPQDPVSRFARSTADEATFGVSNWAIGAAHAFPTIASYFTGHGGDPATDISMSRDESRSDVAKFAEDQPVAATAAKGIGLMGQLGITGGVDAVLGPAVRLVTGARDVAHVAPGVAELAGRSGATGGVVGAAAGASQTPPGSSPSDTGQAALVGLGVGAATGAVLGPVAQGGIDTARAVLGAGKTMSGASGELATGIAGSQPQFATRADAGKVVADAIDAKAQAAKAAGDAAYKDAAAAGAAVHPGVGTALPTLTQSWIRRNGQIPYELGTPESRAQFPKANAAFDAITRLGKTAENGQPIPLDGPPGTPSIADTRRLLNSPAMTADATNAGDRAALTAVRRAYNEVFIQTGKMPGALVDAATGAPASSAAVTKTVEGNASWTRYKSLTAPARDDFAGQKLAAWKDDSATGAAVAADLYGLSTNPRTVSNAVQVVGRIKTEFGQGSQEFNAVQQGLFLKTVGDNPQAPLTVKQTKANLIALTTGPGKPLFEAVYGPQQQAAIRRFMNSIPDNGPSRAGDMASRVFHMSGAALGALLGFQYGGDLVGAVGSQVPSMMIAGGAMGAGSGIGGFVGHAVSNFMSRDSVNPLLYKPVFLSRAGRVAGETAAAKIGGGTAGLITPEKDAP